MLSNISDHDATFRDFVSDSRRVRHDPEECQPDESDIAP